MGEEEITMRRNTCNRVFGIAALAALLLGVARPTLASQPPTEPAALITTRGVPSSGRAGESTDAARQRDYAAREAASRDLEGFVGGSLIVISAGALTIVLLVVLLIVLL
jgi:hypothetical protein